jgi:hypothetical protein
MPTSEILETAAVVPLHGSEMRSDKIVPNSYIVILRPGSTLAQHKTAVAGVDLDLVIDHIMPPVAISGQQGVIMYSAKLTTKTLAAVRTDVEHVQLIECNQRVEIHDGTAARIKD